jgi:transposase InsO family protein
MRIRGTFGLGSGYKLRQSPGDAPAGCGRGRAPATVIPADKGLELTSRHFLACWVERQIGLVHNSVGKPTQNARIESFHGRLRDECLTVSWFQNLFDAGRKIAAWRELSRVVVFLRERKQGAGQPGPLPGHTQLGLNPREASAVYQM